MSFLYCSKFKVRLNHRMLWKHRKGISSPTAAGGMGKVTMIPGEVDSWRREGWGWRSTDPQNPAHSGCPPRLGLNLLLSDSFFAWKDRWQEVGVRENIGEEGGETRMCWGTGLWVHRASACFLQRLCQRERMLRRYPWRAHIWEGMLLPRKHIVPSSAGTYHGYQESFQQSLGHATSTPQAWNKEALAALLYPVAVMEIFWHFLK